MTAPFDRPAPHIYTLPGRYPKIPETCRQQIILSLSRETL